MDVGHSKLRMVTPMKIGSYSLAMLSVHELETSNSVTEKRQQLNGIQPQSNPPVKLEISEQAKQTLQQELERSKTTGSSSTAAFSLDKYVSSQTLMKKSLLEQILSAITGKKIHIRLYPEESSAKSEETVAASQMQLSFSRIQMSQQPVQPALQAVTRTETYMESERLSFSAAGSVQTADGREIQFSSQFDMSREFYASSVTQSIGKLTDPLTINFGGGPAGLTDQKYDFDLNGDGKREQISFVTPESGFLTLDRNHDGAVNDGSELFGPASGNGFGELRMFDGDHNGWIDENDAVFHELKIWSKDASGKDQMVSLAEKGVGAIFLGSVKAEFSLKNLEQTNGASQRAGLFLKEDGNAGTVQQIDLVV